MDAGFGVIRSISIIRDIIRINYGNTIDANRNEGLRPSRCSCYYQGADGFEDPYEAYGFSTSPTH